MVYTEDLIKKYNLFWQYPVITEKHVYEQEKDKDNYFGIPWATLIDKYYHCGRAKPNQHEIFFNMLKEAVKPDSKYYTCCQHISFRVLFFMKLIFI